MTLSRRNFILRSSALYAALAASKFRAMASAVEETGLKDVFKDDFYIGTAISGSNMRASEPAFMNLVSKEFNAITMENSMKWERIHPGEKEWDWKTADKFVKYGLSQNMYIVGHVLVWHSQVAPWVFKGENGKDVSKKVLLKRMEEHISTLAGRYNGKMDAWDVVNESVDEGNGWRKSPWLKIIGPEFMDKAFHYAADADPNAHLIYNDYNMHSPDKRKFVVNFLREFKKKGVPIHGVGMQGHVGLSYPNINEFESSIKAYAAEGVKVHITELDLDVLPVAWEYMGAEISKEFEYSDQLNPYVNGLPPEVEKKLNDRYVEYFKLFLKYRDNIERVTFWGTSDAESWKNNFPVRGRTNYPLMFDRDYKRKSCYDAITALKK